MGEPRDVKEFVFCGSRNIQIFEAGDFRGCPEIKSFFCPQFVTCANRYGRVFALTPKKELLCFQINDIDAIVRTRETANVPITNFPCKRVDLQTAVNGNIDFPTHICVNSDDSTLAVATAKSNTPFLIMFDVRAFSDENTGAILPFLEVRLTSRDGARMADFQWNPAVPEMFCAASSDGTLLTAQIRSDGKGFQILGAAGLTMAAPLCVCWSPKGKQVAVGKSDGTLTQYKQNLELAKSIPPPPANIILPSDPSVAGDTTMCLSLCWLSTSQFAALYAPKSKSSQISLCVVSLSKEKPPVWTPLEDICYGYGQLLRPRYFMHHIPAWQMLLCTSTVATETAILGSPDKGVQDAAHWVSWSLDDTGRAELPAGVGDPHALGAAVAYCSQKSIDMGNGTTATGAPMLLVVSTDGLLCTYSMINKLPLASGISLVMKPVYLTVNGMRDPLPVASAPAETAQKPAFGALTAIGSKPVLGNIQPKAFLGQSQSVQPKLVTTSTGSVHKQVTKPIVQAADVATKPEAAVAGQKSEPPRKLVTEKRDGDSGKVEVKSVPPEVLELRKFVTEEIKKFDRKLALVKQKLANPITAVGAREELIELPKMCADVEKDLGALSGRVGALKEANENLRQNLLDDLANLEGAKVLAERIDTPELVHLVRHRPLAPELDRKSKEYERNLRIFEDQMAELEMNVKNIKMEGGSNIMCSPTYGYGKVTSMELVYRTISNMQAVMTEQKRKFNRLTININRVKSDAREGGTMKYHGTRNLTDLSDRLQGTKISGAKKSSPIGANLSSPTRIAALNQSRSSHQSSGVLNRSAEFNVPNSSLISAKTVDIESQKKIREFLMGRQTTPHRSTIPTLSPPKFKWPESRKEEILEKKDIPESRKEGTPKKMAPPRKTSAFSPVSLAKPVQTKPVLVERGLTDAKTVPATTAGFGSLFGITTAQTAPLASLGGAGGAGTTFSFAPKPASTMQKPASQQNQAAQASSGAQFSSSFKFNWGNSSAGAPQIGGSKLLGGPAQVAPAVNVTVAKPISKPVTEFQSSEKSDSPPKPAASVGGFGFPIGQPLGTSTPAVKVITPDFGESVKEQETPAVQPVQKPVEDPMQRLAQMVKSVEGQPEVSKEEQVKPVTVPVVPAEEKTPVKPVSTVQEESVKAALPKAAVSRTLDVSATSSTIRDETAQEVKAEKPVEKDPEIPVAPVDDNKQDNPVSASENASVAPLATQISSQSEAANTTIDDGMMEDGDDATCVSSAPSLFSGSSGFEGTLATSGAATETKPIFGGGTAFGGGTQQAADSGGSSFGGFGGGLFGGLGGKPSAEAASRNPFGSGLAFGGGASQQSKSIFGAASPMASGTSSGFEGSFGGIGSQSTGGAFSSGAGQSGTGFGGFGSGLGTPAKFTQPSSSPFGGPAAFGGGGQTSGGFGGSPGFGSPAGFGGASPGGQSAFGGSPSFGGTGKVFGATATGTTAFGGTGFGGLAAQSGGTSSGFGALASMGSGVSAFGGSSGFGGTSPTQGSVFGGAASNAPASFTQFRG